MKLYDAISAYLSAESVFENAIKVADGLAVQYRDLQEKQADKDKLWETEEKLKEAGRVTVNANFQWQQASGDLRKAILSEASWRIWNPILSHDAEDVAQEVFYKFLKDGPRNDISHAKNWIPHVIKNERTNLLRKRGSEEKILERVRMAHLGIPFPPGNKDVPEPNNLETDLLQEERVLGGIENPSPISSEGKIAGVIRKGEWEEDIENPPSPDNEDDEEVPGTDNLEEETSGKKRTGVEISSSLEEETLERVQLERWRAELQKAIDAAHKAIKNNTKLEDPDTKRKIFEEVDLYERHTAEEIVAQAQPDSPYAITSDSEEEWKRAINLVEQHTTRYRKALKKVVEGLFPEQQAIVSSVVLQVEIKKSKCKTPSEASGPTQGKRRSAKALCGETIRGSHPKRFRQPAGGQHV